MKLFMLRFIASAVQTAKLARAQAGLTGYGSVAVGTENSVCILQNRSDIVRVALMVMLFIATSVTHSYAQSSISLDVPRVVPISPTAAAMDKYQSYPVDHSTGIPNINIPLYEIVAGEVTIPVSLSYHASGLKPKEASTFAGTGWTLSLEPSVTRQVRGAPDDDSYGWFNNPHGNYYPYSEQQKISYYNQLVDNIRDTQPDKFSYKLAGGGGSGYFSDRFNFLAIPRNNHKVEYRDASGIRITDASGVKYLFDGEGEKAGDVITRWMCKTIWSPNNQHQPLVEFSYTTLPGHHSLGYYYNLDDKVFINKYRYGNVVKNIFTARSQSQTSHFSIDYVPNNANAYLRYISEWEAGVDYPWIPKHTSDIMMGVRLNKVDFMGNEMSVSYKSLGGDSYHSTVLDDIEVVDQNGALVRRVKFYITPYNPNTSLTKLDSVVISAPGAESRKYSFYYNNALQVPSHYTKSVDHWGFCNGPDYAGASTVPSFQQSMGFPDVNGGPSRNLIVTYSGASREPSHSRTKTGVLFGITDPQGITTSFTYEGNYGAFRDNSKPYNKDYLHPVGGLRVRRIETHDPKSGKRIKKDYTYGLTRPEIAGFKPVWHGGAIKHIVTIRDYASSILRRNKDPYTTEEWYENITTYGSMPESNISFNGGSAVMYNVVTEMVTQSGDNEYHKTDYYYNVKIHKFEDVLRWDSADPIGSVQTFLREQPETVVQQIARVLPAHPQEPPDDHVGHFSFTDQFYGKLIRRDHFRRNILASRTDFSYKAEAAWGSNISMDLPHRRIIGNTEGLSAYDVFTTGNSGGVQTTYYMDTETYAALEKETENVYYDIDGMQEVVTTQKIYDYQFDWTLPGSSLQPRRIQTVNSDGTVAVDSMDYLLGYPAVLSRHKHMENSSWKENRILFRPNSSLPHKVQSRTDRAPVFRDEITYNTYDSYGNVTELMGKDGMPVSFIWCYHGQLPVARIENATIQQVYDGTNVFQNWTSYAEPPFALWSKLELLRTELPQARISTFEYKPLKGVVSITDANKITTKFDYDHYGRLTGSYFLDVRSPTDIRKAMLQKYIYNLGK